MWDGTQLIHKENHLVGQQPILPASKLEHILLKTEKSIIGVMFIASPPVVIVIECAIRERRPLAADSDESNGD
jgi:hypothetical protein